MNDVEPGFGVAFDCWGTHIYYKQNIDRLHLIETKSGVFFAIYKLEKLTLSNFMVVLSKKMLVFQLTFAF